ncbi:MAG: PTS sugar transporter subunit IIC [Clostridia bacterium]|nr:PTS sugar transporter subunit IIC [Clostridia bacterium]
MKKWLKKAYKRYLIDALSAMGMGLFASLIIGLIISQLSKIPFLNFLEPFGAVVSASSPVVGAAIGVAVGHGLKVAPLAVFSCAAAGAFGYQMSGPVGAYIASVIGAELGGLVAGKTKLDIILVPTVCIVSGGLITKLTAPAINAGIAALQSFIEKATALQPIPMGIVVSVVFGLALTAPISSAALAAMIFTVPEGGQMGMGLQLAAGAATVGCCCQMVGFAVSSFRENGVSGLIAQGLGTSMLQVGNILKAPAILIPPTLTSAILGPFATTIFQMKNAASAAGMGTSGLVGQFGTWAAMAGEKGVLWKMLLLHFVLPAILSLLISEFMRKKNWIKPGDMKLGA